MQNARMLAAVVALLALAGGPMNDAVACRIIPTPMPIVRPGPRPQPAYRPLETRSHRADITVDGPVATVAVNAVFYNPNSRVLEGTYFFPLAADAAVDDFQMDINGKMVKGELLDADKARKIYEDIVRRMKDPGLLEFVGTRMLKCRVFPMAPTAETKVKLTYSVTLRADAGLYELAYPLRSAKPEAGKIATCAVRVRLRQRDGIKTLYSPTHKVDVTRKGDGEATVGFEQANLLPERDFRLYFSTSKKDVGLSVLTHKPAGEDGYFLLAAAPKVEVDDKAVVAKRIVFAIDTSGSMQGEKIRQARDALKYCVQSLRPADQFALIPFATEPRAFRDALAPASRENVKAAVGFIDTMEARGGTAIDDALQLALKTLKGGKGLPMVVFLTDGLPTIGETDIDAILKNVQGANAEKARVFVFGVGYDVNTKLLDRLARDNHGAPDYVTPTEDIEVRVSSFYQKVANPVLSDVKLEIGGLKLSDAYPRELPDLFRGGQLLVLGRFRGKGHHAVKLSGTVSGKARHFVFEADFAETQDNAFLPRLWAVRKVTYLLGAIRRNGEKKELVDEVVRLAKRHGILTPYTSFLVVDDKARPELAENLRRGRVHFRDADRGPAAVEASKLLERLERELLIRPDIYADVVRDPAARKELRRLAKQKIVQIGDKTFYLRADGTLVDSLFDAARHKGKVVEIKLLSEEHLALARKHAKLRRCLAEGKAMLVTHGDAVFRIVDR